MIDFLKVNRNRAAVTIVMVLIGVLVAVLMKSFFVHPLAKSTPIPSQKEIETLRAVSGLTGLRGRGVKVILNDSPEQLRPGENPNLLLIHEEDLLRVVNELRAAGAEAIAINGQRLIAMSEIRCAGNTILVNTRKIVPPIEILATGDPTALKTGLEIKGGVIYELRAWGLIANIQEEQDIKVPPYKGTIHFEYSKPFKAGES